MAEVHQMNVSNQTLEIRNENDIFINEQMNEQMNERNIFFWCVCVYK